MIWHCRNSPSDAFIFSFMIYFYFIFKIIREFVSLNALCGSKITITVYQVMQSNGTGTTLVGKFFISHLLCNFVLIFICICICTMQPTIFLFFVLFQTSHFNRGET